MWAKLDKSFILTEIVLIGCSKKLSLVVVYTLGIESFKVISSSSVQISTAFSFSFLDETLSLALLPLRSKRLGSYSSLGVAVSMEDSLF